MTLPLLQIENLTVAYQQGPRWLPALRDIALTVNAGEIYGLVGESGSGKSTLALAIMNYLSANGQVRAGSIRLRGRELASLSPAEMRQIWQSEVRLIPQNPLAALNPSLRIGDQIAESFDPNLPKTQMDARVLEVLARVHLADPTRIRNSYPHQLSGGQQQRVMIAMALTGEPALLVMDERTTNLDVTTEAAILELIRELIVQSQTAVLYVTHNLGVVAQLCDRVAVLYAGELVEDAAVHDLFAQPLHPYTQALLQSIPRLGYHKSAAQLQPITGQIPALDQLPTGCVFEPRCALANERAVRERPALEDAQPGHRVRCHRWHEIMAGSARAVAEFPATPTTVPYADPPQVEAAGGASARLLSERVLTVENLRKEYEVSRSLHQLVTGVSPQHVKAVDGIDLQLRRNETLGLVGESGSGKSTVARCTVGLVERSGGELQLLNMPLAPTLAARAPQVLRRVQMVMQNADDALNPYIRVGDALRRPLMRLAGLSRAAADEAMTRLLAAVKLSPTYAVRRPDQLSGGEKQRVAIARAFASQPDLLLLDESVSGLDVSVQATILNLLNELQQENGSAYLLISHDLAVVSYLADVIAVIYLGQLMEVGRTTTLLTPPYHPYTEALLSAVPVPDPTVTRQPILLEGEVPSPIQRPTGCPFHTRCHRRSLLPDPQICVQQAPPWRTTAEGQRIYCHIPLDQLHAVQQSTGQRLRQ